MCTFIPSHGGPRMDNMRANVGDVNASPQCTGNLVYDGVS